MDALEAPKTKTPALGGETGLLQTLVNQQRLNATTRPRQPFKWQRVLAAFVSGRSYNRFQAERELHDHCLHSTVSTLQSMGVTIDRRMETVPGFQGCPTDVMRYWLPPESHQKALELLGRLPPCPDNPGTSGAAVGHSDATAGV